MRYRDEILKKANGYYQKLNDKDFSHDINHIFRVERLAKNIAKAEGADLEVVEAASLLFDIARGLEDEGKVEDHAEAGAEIAREFLVDMGFPAEKTENVCHCIKVHRKSKGLKPETKEAGILQDADYLDAMGAVDVARVIASSLQSEKYKRPVYVDRPYDGDENASAIHYLQYKLQHPRLDPKRFNTATGKKLAKDRFRFMREYVDRFIAEWEGRS